MRSKENPFKFGTIVDGEFFTDRIQEVRYIEQYIQSANHLVLISPRRFGKSSVVSKALKESGRESITINLQQVTSVLDFSAKILKEFFKIHKMEQVRHYVSHFRFVPTVSVNPLTNSFDIMFQPGIDGDVCLEDVFSMIENSYSEEKRLVIVFDEFQEIIELEPRLDRRLRAIMQKQNNVNYILLGSQESMMTDIFEKKKSPFYHFGEIMRLSKLPRDDFFLYISERLVGCYPENYKDITAKILDVTGCHPYYSQQLAATIWQFGILNPDIEEPVSYAIGHIVLTHGLDFERLWMNMNRTNKWILQRLSLDKTVNTGEYKTSTVYSALKRLQKEGYVIYSDRFELEDPFFKEWIKSNL